MPASTVLIMPAMVEWNIRLFLLYLFQYKQVVPARIKLASIVAKRADIVKPEKACPVIQAVPSYQRAC
jgi:hypothetical protein